MAGNGSCETLERLGGGGYKVLKLMERSQVFATVTTTHRATLEMDGDEYVPIAADAGVELQGESVGLRYGDYSNSLFEFMFDSATGVVRRLAMPAWKQPRASDFTSVSRNAGIPVIEPSTRTYDGPDGWKRIDCPHDVVLLLQDRTLQILIEGGGKPVEAIGSGRLAFLVEAAKRLVGLEVSDLKESELQTLTVR